MPQLLRGLMNGSLAGWSRTTRKRSERVWEFETRIEQAITSGRINSRPERPASPADSWVGEEDDSVGLKQNQSVQSHNVCSEQSSDTPCPSVESPYTDPKEHSVEPMSSLQVAPPVASSIVGQLVDVSLVDIGAEEPLDMKEYNIIDDPAGEDSEEAPGCLLVSRDISCEVCGQTSENLSKELLTDFERRHKLCWSCTVCNSLWKAERRLSSITNRDKSIIWADRMGFGPNGVNALETSIEACQKVYPIAEFIKEFADHTVRTASRAPAI